MVGFQNAVPVNPIKANPTDRQAQLITMSQDVHMKNQEVHKYLRNNKLGINLSKVEETKRNYGQVNVSMYLFLIWRNILQRTTCKILCNRAMWRYTSIFLKLNFQLFTFCYCEFMVSVFFFVGWFLCQELFVDLSQKWIYERSGNKLWVWGNLPLKVLFPSIDNR